MSRPFTIADDGDDFEQRSWWHRIGDHFPSYETFWVARIVPLTYRAKDRRNVHFQTTAELASAGYTDEDVAIAQLHYTIASHLGRAFDLLDDARAFTSPGYVANRPFGPNETFECFARLSGASDVADELLQRRAAPGTYDPWDERKGRDAREAWRRAHGNPLRPVRAYRNRLVHGRVLPSIFLPATNHPGQMLLCPRLDKVDAYLDWRVAFATAGVRPSPDFGEAAIIVADAWTEVVGYVEQAWQTHLLPNL